MKNKCEFSMKVPKSNIILCGYFYDTTIIKNGIKYAHFPECNHKECPIKKKGIDKYEYV